MTREEAIEKLKNPPLSEKESSEIFNQVSSKLEISNGELTEYFNMLLKTFKDYKNQETLFKIGAKIMNLLRLDKLIRK